jgi:hypothetical protein
MITKKGTVLYKLHKLQSVPLVRAQCLLRKPCTLPPARTVACMNYMRECKLLFASHLRSRFCRRSSSVSKSASNFLVNILSSKSLNRQMVSLPKMPISAASTRAFLSIKPGLARGLWLGLGPGLKSSSHARAVCSRVACVVSGALMWTLYRPWCVSVMQHPRDSPQRRTAQG